MPDSGPSNISSGSLLDLKAIAAEHFDRFEKEGRSAVRGQRNRPLSKVKDKDPFARPSPGLVKRLAAEARTDAKRRVFQDEHGGPSDEQRREIMLAKAKKYDALKRGDYSGMSEKEIQESVIDFDRKQEEDSSDGYSDHSSDQDESAALPRGITGRDQIREDDHEIVEYEDEMGRTRTGTRREAREAETARRKDPRNRGIIGRDQIREDDHEIVEYEDEMGRTRTGTRREAREAETARRKDPRNRAAEQTPQEGVGDQSSYAEVMNSKVIHGDQNFFPVYEPDPDALRRKYLAAEEEARAHHYDSTKEVRVKGAGQYQFSLDEEKRAEQMASLNAERQRTESARQARGGISKAQEERKRKLDERREMLEAKRIKVLGKDEVERLKREKREKEAETFLSGLDRELQGGGEDEAA